MMKLKIYKKLNGGKGSLELKIDETIQKGDLVSLYGPSGSGKTTLLRIIAGLCTVDQGAIECDGITWLNQKQGIQISIQDRKIGFVFQDYALFPNMTVLENLQFALSKNQDPSILQELIETMELSGLLNQKPNMLSGGQQQRLALARALVQKPNILLLDEPLSALDPAMRSKLQDYILKVHKKYALTTILVSHDIGEICKLSNQVMVIEGGTIAKKGVPSEIFGAQNISGKFQFTGELINIQQESVVYILTILIGNNLVKVVADEREVKALSIGDKVLVASKAFNPIVQKLN